MSNSNLSCSATNCTYNNASICYAGGINVDGSRATTTSSTACVSFQDRTTSSVANSTGEYNLVKTGDISCQATNCSYNYSGSCKAPNVQINAQNASCETFVLSK